MLIVCQNNLRFILIFNVMKQETLMQILHIDQSEMGFQSPYWLIVRENWIDFPVWLVFFCCCGKWKFTIRVAILARQVFFFEKKNVFRICPLLNHQDRERKTRLFDDVLAICNRNQRKKELQPIAKSESIKIDKFATARPKADTKHPWTWH